MKQVQHKFAKGTTKHNNICLVSIHKFKYVQAFAKCKQYKDWKCSRNKETKCKARFCGSFDDRRYWKHNPFHTCVNPPQNDLTQQEEEEINKV